MYRMLCKTPGGSGAAPTVKYINISAAEHMTISATHYKKPPINASQVWSPNEFTPNFLKHAVS